MAHYTSELTQRKLELLVTGYMRSKLALSSRVPLRVPPPEIISLFVSFIDEYSNWDVNGDELIQFLSTQNGEAIVGPSFYINNIFDVKFTLYLIPNGINKSECGYIQFLIEPQFNSLLINSITLYYKLLCRQTNSAYNNTIIIYSTDRDCASWPVHTLSLQNVFNIFKNQNQNKNKNIRSSIYNYHQLNNIEYGSLLLNMNDILSFSCFLDIYNIDYVNNGINTKIFQYNNSITMNKYTKFQWNIYDNLLNEFRYCVYGKYYFKNLNQNWMLECAPNGQSKKDEGNVNVLLSLLRLPYNISAVMVHMVLLCDFSNIKWDFKLRFDYNNNSYGWPEYTLLSSYLLETTSITFTVQLTIINIFDRNNNQISINEWDKYGIIDNKQELNKKFDNQFKKNHKKKLIHINKSYNSQFKLMKKNTKRRISDADIAYQSKWSMSELQPDNVAASGLLKNQMVLEALLAMSLTLPNVL